MTKTDAVNTAGTLYDGLNRLVMAWDPYGLSRSGEIDDEFSDEVWAVLRRLPDTASADDVAAVVADVFGRAFTFSPDVFDADACRVVASRIHTWWSAEP